LDSSQRILCEFKGRFYYFHRGQFAGSFPFTYPTQDIHLEHLPNLPVVAEVKAGLSLPLSPRLNQSIRGTFLSPPNHDGWNRGGLFLSEHSLTSKGTKGQLLVYFHHPEAPALGEQLSALDPMVQPIGTGWAQVKHIMNLDYPSYHPKTPPDLSPESDVQMGIKDALSFFTCRSVAFLDGIHRDVHPEWLHGFRILNRKCRSILQEARRDADAKVVRQGIALYRAAGEQTNHLRDLDVLCLNWEHWSPQGGGSPDQQAWWLHARKLRDRAFLQLRKQLEDQSWERQAWHFIDHHLKRPEPPDHLDTLSGWAHQRFTHRIQRCLKLARQLEHDHLTPDNQLTPLAHRLRIEGKKARYVYESFTSLMDPTETYPAKALKKLQECLGVLHDIQVQETWCRQQWEQSQGSKNPLSWSPVQKQLALQRRQLWQDWDSYQKALVDLSAFSKREKKRPKKR
jgi:CHAD domain-containing protein